MSPRLFGAVGRWETWSGSGQVRGQGGRRDGVYQAGPGAASRRGSSLEHWRGDALCLNIWTAGPPSWPPDDTALSRHCHSANETQRRQID